MFKLQTNSNFSKFALPNVWRSDIQFEFGLTNLKCHGGDLYPGIIVWLLKNLKYLSDNPRIFSRVHHC